jgi:hypothetical protein
VQAWTEVRGEHVHILSGGDAAEQHDAGVRPHPQGQPGDVAFERLAIARVAGLDIHLGELA